MKKMMILLVLISFISPMLQAEMFVLKNYQIAEGEIIQETDTFIVVKKSDNSQGYIRKDQIEYRMPDMKVSKLLEKGLEYKKNNDYMTAYYFYLAAEYLDSKKPEVIAGLAVCLIERKEYDKALSKIKYGLLWEKSNELTLLLGEIYSLKGEFDQADEVLSKLKKKEPKLAKVIDEQLKKNEERRLFEKARNSTPTIKDFKDQPGNCQDAVDNAKKLLEWSKENAEDIFESLKLDIFVVGRNVEDYKDVDKLRDNVSVVDLEIIVDREKFSGVKSKYEEKDRKLLAYGWYFFIVSTYPNANHINIEICYEYTNRKEKRIVTPFARVKWASGGKNIGFDYIR